MTSTEVARESEVVPFPKDDRHRRPRGLDAGMVEGVELPRLLKVSKGGRGTLDAIKVHRVIAGVRAGMSLVTAVEAAGLHNKAWHNWCEQEPRLRDLLVQAQEVGTHVLAHECLQISDEVLEDRDAVFKAKLRVETRLNLIKVWNRAYYGDQVQVAANNTFNFNMDTSAADRPPIEHEGD